MAELNIDKMAQNVAERVMQELRDNGVFVSRWVPVSERLPEEYCLFCDIDGDVYYGHIYCNKWWAEGQDDRIKNVVAWMPLPPSYQRGL